MYSILVNYKEIIESGIETLEEARELASEYYEEYGVTVQVIEEDI